MYDKPLTIGMVGENIAAMQQILVVYGLTIPKAELRGRFFGPATRDSVSSWQRGHCLNVTGIVDAATWDTLNATMATSLSSQPALINPSARAREDLFPLTRFGGST